jgi:hypothetical protein
VVGAATEGVDDALLLRLQHGILADAPAVYFDEGQQKLALQRLAHDASFLERPQGGKVGLKACGPLRSCSCAWARLLVLSCWLLFQCPFPVEGVWTRI